MEYYQKKKLSINKTNARENSKRIPHTYRKGDSITLKKLAIPREGPYKVTKHNNNGSILTEKAPTNIKNVNVRRVAPYYRKTELLPVTAVE